MLSASRFLDLLLGTVLLLVLAVVTWMYRRAAYRRVTMSEGSLRFDKPFWAELVTAATQIALALVGGASCFALSRQLAFDAASVVVGTFVIVFSLLALTRFALAFVELGNARDYLEVSPALLTVRNNGAPVGYLRSDIEDGRLQITDKDPRHADHLLLFRYRGEHVRIDLGEINAAGFASQIRDALGWPTVEAPERTGQDATASRQEESPASDDAASGSPVNPP